ncbi:MAG: DUF131 domain-containing protein [Candidatus Parvarchaeota archaeon]|nr:DUF131 domain-containing protein [Candidatus Jingweiarchaeum tengchongense]MCW1298607.1 DUF131 domain-containing protein [Candidatus Jingweiarchaeum tengchongense]MCW1300453.1 DUF131 domain-containing protein [Candidatus Jingweiarchaeum tengchongense]MCW1304957.1 DUF131 domain-containing protein [Candidatus Jingweiarchaeum tengchongense]MCW1305483.1 DUF131 domain-containing protein [Candidatus Jingweiarchaeum tengchongense]
MEYKLISFGIVFIFIGFILLLIGSLLTGTKEDVKFSFVGFIGPFPFGFSNSKEMLYFSIAIGLIIFLLILIFFIKKY